MKIGLLSVFKKLGDWFNYWADCRRQLDLRMEVQSDGLGGSRDGDCQ